MAGKAEPAESRAWTAPLFPLPNIVLFPRAVLPLHIFEDRYKKMTADVLAGERLVAMALLRAGWEKEYYGRPAIEPVVCVGKILSWEKLEDGKYNFLLQGEARGRIVTEEPSAPYRRARIETIAETKVMEIDLTNQRQRLMEMFSTRPLGKLPALQEMRKIVSSGLGTAEVADLIAYHLLSDVRIKQELLGEGDVLRRVGRVIAALDAASPMIEFIATGESESGEYN
jgi:hypothetical protein